MQKMINFLKAFFHISQAFTLDDIDFSKVSFDAALDFKAAINNRQQIWRYYKYTHARMDIQKSLYRFFTFCCFN